MATTGGTINAANNPIRTGDTPFTSHNPATTVLGLSAPLKWIGENPAGDAIAFTYLTSPANTLGLFVRANGAISWTQATTPFTLPSTTNVIMRYLAGKWYFIASDNKIYSSANGLNWTVGGTTGSPSVQPRL